MLKKIVVIVGIVFGVAILAGGIFVMCTDTSGLYASLTTTFGADFYTEEYQATAVAAYNMRCVEEAIYTVGGLLLIAFGLMDIAYFGVSLASLLSSEKPTATVPPIAPTPDVIAVDMPSAVENSDSFIVCPQCQTQVPAGRNFCNQCGTALVQK